MSLELAKVPKTVPKGPWFVFGPFSQIMARLADVEAEPFTATVSVELSASEYFLLRYLFKTFYLHFLKVGIPPTALLLILIS